MPHTIYQTIQLSQTQLAQKLNISKDEARFDSQLLLQHALKVNHAWLVAHALNTMQDSQYKAFEMLFQRRLKGEPIAYILGYREFFGLPLKVSADTLIPRPDTETIVEAALAKIPLMAQSFDKLIALQEQSLLAHARPQLVERYGNDTFSVLDLGTGSGAIALAIAKHRPSTQVTAVDASQAALAIAIENAQNLGIANVAFVLSDWFAALNNHTFDVIVSNPPYIEASDIHLSQGDLRFEPLSALASGADGFDDIRRIINDSPKHLNQNGWLMLEHGYNQAEFVAKLLAKNGFSQISHVKDLAGIMRVTIGRYVAD